MARSHTLTPSAVVTLTRILIFMAIVAVVVGGGHYYLWVRLVRDASLSPAWTRGLAFLLGGLAVMIPVSFMLMRGPRSVSSPIMWIVYTWLGLAFFLLVLVTLRDVVLGLGGLARLLPPDDPERRVFVSRAAAAVVGVLGLGAAGTSMVSALSRVEVKRVKVAMPRLSKSASGYRIVQLSDVHVGPTIGRGFIDDVVRRVNALEADMVVITGDLVDGSVEELREHVAPLAGLRAKDGVFFVTGNHEYYSGADAWIAHLGTLGIRVLRNEHVSIGGADGFDLAGIDDASAHQFGNGHGADLRRALDGRDASRAVVLLAHQPKAIVHAAKLGVDLQLSGHTHGGQLFPFNYLVRLQQPFVAGLDALGAAQIYVSRGTGYWGPPMRLGAPAEITELELVAGA